MFSKGLDLSCWVRRTKYKNLEIFFIVKSVLSCLIFAVVINSPKIVTLIGQALPITNHDEGIDKI